MPVAVSSILRFLHKVTDKILSGRRREAGTSQKTCLHLTFVAFGNKSKRDLAVAMLSP